MASSAAEPAMREHITAILPCNSIPTTRAFFAQLGFARPEADEARAQRDAAAAAAEGREDEKDEYVILQHANGSDIHLTSTPEGWLVPGRNPFGFYVYVEDVDAVAERMQEFVIGKGGAKEQPWGMYEVALNGPDELLVRVGWPLRLRKKTEGAA